uniref:Uncharacterized protein n=1 Tax=Chromera velia CCMP2878 TaxID=1169474 RepID=A0A0G4FYA9_9ALVE|eukprot:Cvel_19222.t1-p1 / transcript=Cvel_19222.t1 / gene=Cvel_19222 / organism=Chromera_velia_CCMP2878 / gene_product=hypothetical protein / transcript_product=hypothetical protein / location=Cvel_scaffold1642:10876-17051(-) / protein_length=122 / sequence_SO=supercontig / SO=protein_coding / is_pseudo=false
MITRTCLYWPKGHRSIKTHPEQVYQRKAAGEGSEGSGEAATLERVYGPHPNTGNFFLDAFAALISPESKFLQDLSQHRKLDAGEGEIVKLSNVIGLLEDLIGKRMKDLLALLSCERIQNVGD